MGQVCASVDTVSLVMSGTANVISSSGRVRLEVDFVRAPDGFVYSALYSRSLSETWPVGYCTSWVEVVSSPVLTSDQVLYVFSWGASAVLLLFVIGFCVGSLISLIRKLPG